MRGVPDRRPCLRANLGRGLCASERLSAVACHGSEFQLSAFHYFCFDFMTFIPVNEPLLDGNEKKYLAECIDTGWISSEGPFVQRLEEGMAQRVGRKYGIAVCNGSAALEVAIAALRLGPGDEVILPTFTIISCACAIVRAGATPVVVDADRITWNMDVG